jgi:hypothetical protein
LRNSPRAASESLLISLPAIVTVPDVGRSRPPSSCSNVVLPEPGRADDRDALARGDLQVDAVQHFDARVALLEVLDQSAARENEVRHEVYSCRSDWAGCVRAARQEG